MKKLFITLLTTAMVSTALLHNNPTVIAEDKLSTYDKAVNETINTCYTNITNQQKNYFTNNNYHIIILKEGQKPYDIDNSYSKEATGLIDFNKKVIYIQYFEDKETMINNTWHELGHMLDKSYNFTSETNDFNDIWNIRDTFFSCFNGDMSYFKNNKSECFAQMYSIYKMFPKWIMENFPYIYNYFLALETNTPTANIGIE